MEILDKNTERSTVLTAVLTLIIIGISLLVSTWQTMSHQRDAEEEHLFLTSRAVALAIGSSLAKGPIRETPRSLSTSASDFFQSLEQEGEILFAGIVSPDGTQLLMSPRHTSQELILPRDVYDALLANKEWHGRILTPINAAYVYAYELPFRESKHPRTTIDTTTPTFLVTAINMEHHLNAYKGIRRNALFQAIYILVAAICTWGLAVSFLARREQARRAGVLERFQAKLLDNLPDGLITLGSHNGQLIMRSANPAASNILELAPSRLVGKPVTTLPANIADYITNSVHQCCPPGWQKLHANDAHLEILILPLSESTDNAFMIIIRDRTELNKLEQSLADAEKLAAIGTLAAGVAHEVRNPLSALRGFAQYFVKKLAGRQPEEEYAQTMVREADRLNRVITDLLFLARQRTIAPRQLALADILDQTITLLRFDIEKKHISIIRELGDPTVYADEDALKQVLLNLFINSLDALTPQQPDCTEQKNPVGSITITSRPAKDGTLIIIRDTGCGMTEEQRAIAFEPFFTGKKTGTGLGLTLVQRTMHTHGGNASIETQEGNGCSIRLYFPNAATSPFPPEDA